MPPRRAEQAISRSVTPATARTRPGSKLARRPLHFFVVADCSGSMAADGKMQALNTAIRETIPHLVDVANQNPHAEVLVRVVAFATGAQWHVAEPTLVDELVWEDLEAGGYTELGTALTLLAGQLRVPPMEARALPPAIVLVSDGMPTDDYRRGLGLLLDEPWGQRSVRMAVGIGRDVDNTVLQQFIGNPDVVPVTANNPEQLIRLIRWVSTHAGRAASAMATGAPVAPRDLSDTVSETVW